MDESMKKTRERLMDEFRQASSAQTWTKECIEMMKNLLKSVYYIDVICAMEDGNDYPGSDYMPETGASFARGGQHRNTMGQYSRNGSYDNRSYYPMSYGMSGRRYYDDEMGSAVHELERMMNSEGNPEKRMALQRILDDLRMR